MDDDIFYSNFPVRKLPTGNHKRQGADKIVVSLTSHGSRLSLVHIVIKCMMHQSMRPDEIVLYLTHNDYENVPRRLSFLKRKGLRIVDVGENNIKSHNKYYYAFTQYPNNIIITVDDDGIYERNMISLLYESYKKYPRCVSAKRCHKIEHGEDGKVKSYNEWCGECQDVVEPSRDLFATGNGGVLYPPKLLRNSMFSTDEIEKYCLNADDVMLKFMEIKENVDVVWVNGSRLAPIDIGESWKTGLAMYNNDQNANDIYMLALHKSYTKPFLRAKNSPSLTGSRHPEK